MTLIATEIKSGNSQSDIHGYTEFGSWSNVFRAQMAYISVYSDNLAWNNSYCHSCCLWSCCS